MVSRDKRFNSDGNGGSWQVCEQKNGVIRSAQAVVLDCCAARVEESDLLRGHRRPPGQRRWWLATRKKLEVVK